MGQQTECRATYEGATSSGIAQLETEELLFRGEFRLRIPFKSVVHVEARRGQLQVTWPQGEAVFDLGNAAESWMLKIRYPKGRLDKLGVKEGLRIAVLGLQDPDFLLELEARVNDVAKTKPKKDTDIVFYGVESKDALEKLTGLTASLKPAGAIWTVYPKGQKHITQNDVMAGGKSAGLVDTKVVGFSGTHTALKWVIPVAKRKE